MTTILIEKRKHILWLQWLLVIAISYLLYFNRPGAYTFSYLDLLILGMILVNAALFFVPRQFFQGSSIDFALVFFDIVLVSTAIYLTGQATSDLYLFFFLILMMAAAGQNLRALILGVLTISGLYAFMVYKTGGFSFTSGFLLRIPFLFIVGLFFGYLVYVQKLGQERLQAESEFTVDLFEFGKALVQTEDLHILYSNIPRLINDIMMTNACEMAIIKTGVIAQRFVVGFKPKEIPLIEVGKSIHAQSYRQPGRIVSSSQLRQDPEFSQKADLPIYPGQYEHYIAKCWKPEGRSAGLIAAYREGPEGWSDHDHKKFQFLTDQTILALQYVNLLKELEMQARTDGLTGLANYRYFAERIEEEVSRAQRHSAPLSLMLMDIDHFKLINDTKGHDTGDEILKCLARVLKSATRNSDIPARRGGDEFVVLLPSTSFEEARKMCKRVLDQVKSLGNTEGPLFSISVGCATFPENGATIAELLERADEALYFAKAQGRGCAWHYSDMATS